MGCHRSIWQTKYRKLIANNTLPSDYIRNISCKNFSTCSGCLSNGDFCRWNVNKQSCEKRPYYQPICSCDMKHVMDCPKKIDPKYGFNATFAKFVMFRLAMAANSYRPEKCLIHVSNDTTLIRRISRPCVSWLTYCSGYTAISKSNKAVMLAFRATVSPFQALSQAFFALLSTTQMLGGGKVNTYYARAFEIIWTNGIEEDLLQLRQKYPDYELWISGFSLGGALATLASRVIVGKKIYDKKSIKLVTFGEPRIFDREFAEVHDAIVPYSYRVVSANDLIPHIIPRQLGYYHRRYEVWYKDAGTEEQKYTVCLSPEDCQCSNSVLFYWPSHHLSYYNVNPLLFTNYDCIFHNSVN